MMTLVIPKKYRVTLENWGGGCKRVTVSAHSPEDAMMFAAKRGWVAVEVKELV